VLKKNLASLQLDGHHAVLVLLRRHEQDFATFLLKIGDKLGFLTISDLLCTDKNAVAKDNVHLDAP
jgi:hypothetical protein